MLDRFGWPVRGLWASTFVFAWAQWKLAGGDYPHRLSIRDDFALYCAGGEL